MFQGLGLYFTPSRDTILAHYHVYHGGSYLISRTNISGKIITISPHFFLVNSKTLVQPIKYVAEKVVLLSKMET